VIFSTHRSEGTRPGAAFNGRNTGHTTRGTAMNAFTVPLLAGAVALAITAPGADARERTGSGSYKTGAGKTATYERKVERTPGQVNRQGSVTTQDGRTYTGSSHTTYDRNTGAVNRDVTGPRGRTTTSTGRYDKATSTYDRTITGAGGAQTHAVTAYDKANKSATTTYTGPGGKTTTSTSIYNAANKGFDTTVTGPGGNTATRSGTNSYNPETGTITHGVTGLGGKIRTVDIAPDKQPQ
jgi:hypothetical protein